MSSYFRNLFWFTTTNEWRNGGITYEAGPADSRPINTIATFTCDNGYALTGGRFRACQNDGTWSGSAPTCRGEFHYILTVASPFLIQWTQDPLNHPPPVLTSLYQPMEWSSTALVPHHTLREQWLHRAAWMDTYPPLPALLPECVYLMDYGVDQLSLSTITPPHVSVTGVNTTSLESKLSPYWPCTSNLPTDPDETNNTGGVVAGVVIVLLILAAVIVVGIIVGVYFWRWDYHQNVCM